MKKHRPPQVWMLVALLLSQIGCQSLRGRQDFDALTQPASLRVPAPDNRFVATTKKAAAGTASVVGGALLLAGYGLLKIWDWSDDDDDRWDYRSERGRSTEYR